MILKLNLAETLGLQHIESCDTVLNRSKETSSERCAETVALKIVAYNATARGFPATDERARRTRLEHA